MGGGLMQLVAYGAQDIYLTGNPQITFFKVVYRRHTNFSMETIEQTINGASTLNPIATTNGTVTISRNGDLVSDVYVSTSTPGITNGDNIVDEVILEIGGQQIDKQNKEWMQIWEELSTPQGKANALYVMKQSAGNSNSSGLTIIPLQFWFCRNPGLALPLIALQYHEVKLKFTFGAYVGGPEVSAAVKVWCDYVYLDTDERRRFAQVSHEYLIEQVQRETKSASKQAKLNFNHPVKELIWTSASVLNEYGDAKLVLNGHDRFAAQEEEYFQLRQPIKYHTTVPLQNTGQGTHRTGFMGKYDTHTPTKWVATSTEGTSTLADLAISGTGVVEVVILGDTGTLTGTTATQDTGGKTPVAASTGYAFLAADFTGGHHPPTKGDVLDISISGLDMFHNATVDATGVVHTKVTDVYAPEGGQVIVIKLDHLLVRDTAVSDEIDFGNEFTIISIRLTSSGGAKTSNMDKRINVYSFALKPEEHQPSGTCNFSRIDNAQLIFNASPVPVNNYDVYAVNYNVLRIMSGMGGLAYSN